MLNTAKNNTAIKSPNIPGSSDKRGGVSGQLAYIEASVHKQLDTLGMNSINKVDHREPASETKLLPEDRRSEYDSTNNYYSLHHKNLSVSSNQGRQNLIYRFLIMYSCFRNAL